MMQEAEIHGWRGMQVATAWICGDSGPEALTLWADAAGYRWRDADGTDTGVTADTLAEAWQYADVAWGGPWHLRVVPECEICA